MLNISGNGLVTFKGVKNIVSRDWAKLTDLDISRTGFAAYSSAQIRMFDCSNLTKINLSSTKIQSNLLNALNIQTIIF